MSAATSDVPVARLFRASCVALMATGMTFAIRGDIMSALGSDFALDKTQLGWISGAAFWGFGLAILLGGPLCDWLGVRKLLPFAIAGHLGGVLLTIVARDFTAVFIGTAIIGIANGLVEASLNPLVATLYARDRIARLTALHASFPGGIVIGGLLAYLLTQLGLGWQAKMLLILPPVVVYTILFVGQKCPPIGRQAAGVPIRATFRELARPLFVVIFLCMWLTSATELGPGQWVSNIFNEVMHSASQAGVLLLVWINGIMYLMRHFGRDVSHRVSPALLLAITALVAASGLSLFGHVSTSAGAFGAAALLAMGTAFWWPTMLGLTATRFPNGGALALGVIGAAGSFSTAVAGPAMGWINDRYGAAAVLPIWSVLPIGVALLFALIHLADRRRGHDT